MADQPSELNRCDHTDDTPFGGGCEHPWCPAGRSDAPERQAAAEALAARIAELEGRVSVADRLAAESAPAPSPSTDTAGDPDRWTAEIAGPWKVMLRHPAWPATVRTIETAGLTQAESLAAQINRPTPDPDALTDLIARLLDEPRCEVDHRYGEHAEGVACAERDAMTLLGRIPPPGSGCA